MTPEHWIGPVIVVSAIAGFVIGGFIFWTSGVLEGRHREQLERLRRLQDEIHDHTDETVLDWARNLGRRHAQQQKQSGTPVPTRQEVRESSLRESANAAARDWQCHDNRCDGKDKHRCHNLDCKAHKVQS